MPSCTICLKIISPRTTSVSCVGCLKEFHLNCAKLTKEDLVYMKESETTWRCEPCTTERRKSMHLEEKTAKGTLSLSDLKYLIDSVLEGQNRIEKDLGSSIELYHTELVEYNKTVNEQGQKLDAALKIIEALQSENVILKKEISFLQRKVDDAEQANNNNCLEIIGLPEDKNENVEEAVISIGQSLGITLTNNAIDYCHRVRYNPNYNGPRPLVVRFIRRADKEQLLCARKVKRDFSTRHMGRQDDFLIFIRERLTNSRRLLFKSVRQKAKDLNYKYVWTKRGNIFIRKADNSQIMAIKSTDDLNSIKA